MAALVNPYNGKSVNVPDESVAVFKERGFKEAEKPRSRRQRTTKTEE